MSKPIVIGKTRNCDVCRETYVPRYRAHNTCSTECSIEDEEIERERCLQERDEAQEAFGEQWRGF